MGRIVIVSGPPGAGKSTVARLLAEQAEGARAIHLHTDDFYAYIRKGFVEPWKPESLEQNTTIMQALAATAGIYARDSYEVVVDGIVGSWFFEPWKVVARDNDLDLRFVTLMPDEAETVARATGRMGPGAMTDAEVVRQMWRAFQQVPSPPHCVLDTTGQSAAATVALIQEGLAAGRFRLV